MGTEERDLLMVPLNRVTSLFNPSGETETTEQVSQNDSPRTSRPEQPSLIGDPVRTGILIFLTLFLALMAVAALVGGIVAAPKSDKVAIGLLAVFGGTLKGMLSVTKMLIK
jgi:hypothetical protein